MPVTNPPKPMTADDLVKLRERLHLTQQELADEARISVRTVQSYEQAVRLIPEWFANHIRTIAKMRRMMDKQKAAV